MTEFTYPVALSEPVRVAVARIPARYSGVRLTAGIRTGDERARTNTHGSILNNNVVKVKPTPESPELPMPGARVSVHDAHDGVVRWVGKSGADGRYYASNLTPGRRMLALAVDESGQFEAVGAGPVVVEAKIWND